MTDRLSPESVYLPVSAMNDPLQVDETRKGGGTPTYSGLRKP